MDIFKRMGGAEGSDDLSIFAGNLTTNKSWEELKLQFPLVIFPGNHNKAYRANTVDSDRIEDR